MIGEIDKRLGGAEFLSLEQHRQARHQQRIGRHRTISPGAGQLVQPPASARIGDLIVVFQEHHERLGREVEGRGAAPLLLPAIILPLIQEAVPRGGDKLLRPPAVIGVVGLVASGHRDNSAVMKIVVDQRVEAVAAPLRRPHQAGMLRLVLTDDKGQPVARRLAHPAHDRCQYVVIGAVEDLLGGVEPQPV